jgi:hypothetical protein
MPFGTRFLAKTLASIKEHKASIRVMGKVGMTLDKLAPYDPRSDDVALSMRYKLVKIPHQTEA